MKAPTQFPGENRSSQGRPAGWLLVLDFGIRQRAEGSMTGDGSASPRPPSAFISLP